jgi:hypothetical protein
MLVEVDRADHIELSQIMQVGVLQGQVRYAERYVSVDFEKRVMRIAVLNGRAIQDRLGASVAENTRVSVDKLAGPLRDGGRADIDCAPDCDPRLETGSGLCSGEIETPERKQSGDKFQQTPMIAHHVAAQAG